jgi:2-amino-4-hydroxy-6-hydroxymethyldihydropteridine diphosphokinase
MPTAYIGIGSNLGNREENCEKSIHLIEEDSRIKITKRSSMSETEPWGIKDQSKFINMAVEIVTDLKPKAMLSLLKKIETESGRIPGRRWGPRVIDLDILFYDDLVLKIPGLEIPHPEICKRDFVLIPLKEIAPEKLHPVLKKKIKELLQEMPE